MKQKATDLYQLCNSSQMSLEQLVFNHVTHFIRKYKSAVRIDVLLKDQSISLYINSTNKALKQAYCLLLVDDASIFCRHNQSF